MSIEKELERRVVKMIEEAGGECLKLTLAGRRGFPDRTLLLPGGRVVFLEFKKSKNAARRRQQEAWIDRLRELGFEAHFCWSLPQVKELCK